MQITQVLSDNRRPESAELSGMPTPQASAIEHGLTRPPPPRNEEVRTYAPGSPERASIRATLEATSAAHTEMPLIIGGREVRTGRLEAAVMPHDHRHVLGEAHLAGVGEVQASIAAANRAHRDWSRQAWQTRAAIFLRAADLLAGPWRDRLNAATMLGQSKTVQQAEIASAAELIDFWRFNVEFMLRLYNEQPTSPPGVWNHVDYRPLEGFVFAVTPFNFTAIAGNLPSAPALMGNTVVWKPAATAKLAAHVVMCILRAAGLPDGVINLVYGDGPEVAEVVLADPTLAGVHFTGSTEVFDSIWTTVARRSGRYRAYPRLVGETGGKNFILAHASADVPALATAIVRGAFEYQGQKCSAASRVFVPESIWPAVRELVCDDITAIQVGDVRDFGNFMGAVIDGRAWQRHDHAIAEARAGAATKIIAGGSTNRSEGYFVHPTLVLTTDLASRLMTDELFGPIVGAYVYPDACFGDIAEKIDDSAHYGLTGAVFATDRRAVVTASDLLRGAAGNFYVNDKPTGAVVRQQPFGGARASGTNDKAGSMWNLMRWVSPRAIKETFVPPKDFRYPYMAATGPC